MGLPVHQFLPLVLLLGTMEQSLVHPLDMLPETLRDICEVLSQSSLLQAEQAQLPQPFLIRELLLSLHDLFHLPFDLLQELHVSLIVRSPVLDTLVVASAGLSKEVGSPPSTCYQCTS